MGVPSSDDLASWERRYAEEGRRVTEPARFVVDAVTHLGVGPGRALDVAGGTGRHAIWLAGLGWSVTLVDGSPTALRLAGEDAATAGVDVFTVQLDLAVDPLPPGSWDLVVVHHYLDRELLRSIGPAVAPGGHLVWAQPTVLDPHPRPGRRHRVGIGEAAGLVVPPLQIVSLVEGMTEGRHEAMVVARRVPEGM